jgi:hypothetical protein
MNKIEELESPVVTKMLVIEEAVFGTLLERIEVYGTAIKAFEIECAQLRELLVVTEQNLRDVLAQKAVA